jgi:predicted MFS family arabinose efflux permease
MTDHLIQRSSRTPEGQTGAHGRVAITRSAEFWLSAALMVVFLFAAAAPTPLYRVYQAEWHFSAATLTAVFAIYVLFLLVTLLVFGSLSDHVGRRPVIAVALAAAVLACVLFLLAHSVTLLFVARALQGVAVGGTVSTLGAVLLDLRPGGGLAPLMSSIAPNIGLAFGAVCTSALVQYGPAPQQLVWWLLLAAFAAAMLLVALMPESATRRPGALTSLRPHVSVPHAAVGTFLRAVPALVAVWALGGFYLSLGPSLAAQLTGSGNLMWGGTVAFLLTGVGAAAALAVRNVRASAVMLGGCLALLVGAGITIAAIETGTAGLLLLGTGVAGLGFGPAFLGAYRAIVPLAAPSDRAGVISAIFTVSYLAMGLPALIAGIVAAQVGLHDTALVYSAAVAGLAGLAGLSFLGRDDSRRTATRPAAPAPEPPPGPCTVPPYVPAARQETEPAKASA